MTKIPRVNRGKILKILRGFEHSRQKTAGIVLILEASGLEWNDTTESPDEVNITARSEYPNYEYLVRRIYGGREIKHGPFTTTAPIGLIRDEVQRMVNDGLLVVGIQSTEFSKINETDGEEDRFDPGRILKAEEIKDFKVKITLTTKGKSVFEYWKSSFPENATAWFALFISLVALLISITK